MSTEDNNRQRALDDASLDFSDEFVTTGATADQFIGTNDVTEALLVPNSAWDFQGISSLESYNLTTPGAATFSMPEPRKRKLTSEPDDDSHADEDDKPVKKTAHNMIEKRYRTNINDKLSALRDRVPSLCIMSKSARGDVTTQDREELHGLAPSHKRNKATVLSKATEYIWHLEKRNNRLLDENNTMQARIAAFEKLFMTGVMNGSISSNQPPPAPIQFPQGGHLMQSQMPQQEGDETPSGMMQVPGDMQRIIAAQIAAGQPYPVPQQPSVFPGDNAAVVRQQQIQQQQVQQQQGSWSSASPYFNKLMVGSLAGLMILEAAKSVREAGV